jgi:hypothetical protein
MRTFSNVTNTIKHTPPKRLHGITGRYAGAVYTAASKVCLWEHKIGAEGKRRINPLFVFNFSLGWYS